MPSDYDAISKSNEEMLGKDTASRKTQVAMYSDFTHFVFEILQNADDYDATEIEFRLMPDRLEIDHNGIPFCSENVKAISYFEKSTSREDLVKTGHFGLGFKSVFAFTATPIIHSGDESFQIYDLYRLREVPCPKDLREGQTRIVLPFNHFEDCPNFIEHYMPAEAAYEKIARRLKALDMISLLFTRRLTEIRWETSDQKGDYLREDSEVFDRHPLLKTRRTTITDGTALETHDVFSRPIRWRESPEREEMTYKAVDIAFQVSADGIVNRRNTNLVVLFPTKIETKMGFLLNGPYRTTPNRESVREENPFNQHLMNETAEMLIETLQELKEMGLLTISLLEALPIRPVDFPEGGMFRNLYDAVRGALMTLPLLPTDEGSYGSGAEVKLARGADLRRLLSSDHLQALYDSSSALRWLPGGITRDRTPDLRSYLMAELSVEEVTPEVFVSRMSDTFLEKQGDEWMERFYVFLSAQENLWRDLKDRRYSSSPLAKVDFIRLQDGRHVFPFNDLGEPIVYLPSEENFNHPTVKREVLQNQLALNFIQRLGIQKIGERDKIIWILKTQYGPDSPFPDEKEHLQHTRYFVQWYKKSGSAEIFKEDYLFLRSEKEQMGKPDEFYLDMPFKETGLHHFFEYTGHYVQDKLVLWEAYDKIDGFVDFAVAVGVQDRLRIIKRSTSHNPARDYLRKYGNARWTEYFMDNDYWIEGIEKLLSSKKVPISRLVWNAVSQADSKVWTAQFRPNKQYAIQESPSALMMILKRSDWIATKNEEFLKPSEIGDIFMLPQGFRYPNPAKPEPKR